jgi:hypothetical protein
MKQTIPDEFMTVEFGLLFTPAEIIPTQVKTFNYSKLDNRNSILTKNNCL